MSHLPRACLVTVGRSAPDKPTKELMSTVRTTCYDCSLAFLGFGVVNTKTFLPQQISTVGKSKAGGIQDLLLSSFDLPRLMWVHEFRPNVP